MISEIVLNNLKKENSEAEWVSQSGNIFKSNVEILDSVIQESILDLLRIERNKLLQQTDWWVLPDRTATPAQLAYRQALRDLPANSTPTLDENGNLTGVEWPVYSEEA
jgi:hypothetical protein